MGDSTRDAKLTASILTTIKALLAGQPLMAVPVAAAEGLGWWARGRSAEERKRRLQALSPSFAAAFRDDALAGHVPGDAQRTADAVVTLVAGEIEALGVLDLPGAEAARERLASEGVAGLGAVVAEALRSDQATISEVHDRVLNAAKERLQGFLPEAEAAVFSRKLAEGVVAAIAADPSLRHRFEQAHWQQASEILGRVIGMLDRLPVIEGALADLDRRVAEVARVPTAAQLRQIIELNWDRLAEVSASRLRRHLCRPFTDREAQRMAEEDPTPDGPDGVPHSFAYVPHVVDVLRDGGADPERETRPEADFEEVTEGRASLPRTSGMEAGLLRQDVAPGEREAWEEVEMESLLERLASPAHDPFVQLVQARAGFGKSTFLAWLAWRLTAERRAPAVLLEARKDLEGHLDTHLLAKKVAAILDWPERMEDADRRENYALALVERGLILVLVDGLDQVPELAEKVRDLGNRSKPVRILASCREELGRGAGLDGWSGLLRLRHPRAEVFKALVTQEVRDLLEKTVAAREGLLDQEESDRRHPFFLHVARVLVHTGSVKPDGNASLCALLNRYIEDLVFLGRERKETGRPETRSEVRTWQLDVLGRVGLASLRFLHGGGGDPSALQITDGAVWDRIVREACDAYPGREPDVEDFLDATRHDAHILHLLDVSVAEPRLYEYHHQLVQEYLGALGIAQRVERSRVPLETLLGLVADVVSPREVDAKERGRPIEGRVLGLHLWSMLGELLVTREQELAKDLVKGISTWLLENAPGPEEESPGTPEEPAGSAAGSPGAVEAEQGGDKPLEISPLLAVRDAIVEALDRLGVFNNAEIQLPTDSVVVQFAGLDLQPDPFMVLCWKKERELIRAQVASVADWLLEQEGVQKKLKGEPVNDLREACAAGDVGRRIEALAPALKVLLEAQLDRLPHGSGWKVKPYGPTLAAFQPKAKEPSWVLVPHGPFVAGDVGYGDELPVRVVNVDRPFWIGFDPVTVKEYAQFVGKDGYGERLDGPWWDPFRVEAAKALGHRGEQREPWRWKEQQRRPERPVVDVTWFEAAAFCLWRGASDDRACAWGRPFRLPVEAQWEKAACGVLGRRWPWGCAWRPGLVIHDRRWDLENLAPVGENLNRSSFGARGMAGNAWEWTATRWQDRLFGDEVSLGQVKYGDPISVRGGSFYVGRHYVRCASRNWFHAGDHVGDWGFRCLRDVLP